MIAIYSVRLKTEAFQRGMFYILNRLQEKTLIKQKEALHTGKQLLSRELGEKCLGHSFDHISLEMLSWLDL